jgi:hypothetical protein
MAITRRGQRAFEITGLTWIAEHSVTRLGRNRGMSRDREYRVQTPEALTDTAAIRPCSTASPSHLILLAQPLSIIIISREISKGIEMRANQPRRGRILHRWLHNPNYG